MKTHARAAQQCKQNGEKLTGDTLVDGMYTHREVREGGREESRRRSEGWMGGEGRGVKGEGDPGYFGVLITR